MSDSTAPDAAAVATAFGMPGSTPRLTGPVARGYMGRIWRLDTDAGSWAVKESLAPLDRSHVRTAAAFELAAAVTGVPIPMPVLVDGDPVQVVGGRELRAHDWVELAELDRELDPSLVGEMLARLHRVEFAYPGSADTWYTDPVGAATWDDLIRAAARARAPFAEALAASRTDLLAIEALIRPPRAMQTCHRDLFADNVRAAGGGLCVFDWENCGEADPAGELGMVLMEFSWTDHARAGQLYRAYCEAGGPARVTGPETFGMVIAVVQHIGEIGVRRWLAADRNDDDAERAINLGRITEFLGEPLTAPLIHDLVDAVGVGRPG